MHRRLGWESSAMVMKRRSSSSNHAEYTYPPMPRMICLRQADPNEVKNLGKVLLNLISVLITSVL